MSDRSVFGAILRLAVEHPAPSPERSTQALTEQGQLCEHWENLAGLEGLPALLGPPQTYRIRLLELTTPSTCISLPL